MDIKEQLNLLFNDRKAPDGSLVKNNFFSWFGNSVIYSENSGPLKLYHSTKSDFKEFRESSDIGYHFGTSDQAAFRAEKQNNDRTMSVYLSINNPLEMPDLGDWDFWKITEDGMPNAFYEKRDGSLGVAFKQVDIEYVAKELSEKSNITAGWEWLRNYFESKGYDGIKYANVGESEDEAAGDYSYIAFRPEQIKSAIGNSGAFNRSDPDLTDTKAILLANAITARLSIDKSAKKNKLKK
jgi:hypothetical protein